MVIPRCYEICSKINDREWGLGHSHIESTLLQREENFFPLSKALVYFPEPSWQLQVELTTLLCVVIKPTVSNNQEHIQKSSCKLAKTQLGGVPNNHYNIPEKRKQAKCNSELQPGPPRRSNHNVPPKFMAASMPNYRLCCHFPYQKHSSAKIQIQIRHVQKQILKFSIFTKEPNIKIQQPLQNKPHINVCKQVIIRSSKTLSRSAT